MEDEEQLIKPTGAKTTRANALKLVNRVVNRKPPATANDSLASYMANSYKKVHGGTRGGWSRTADSVKVNYPKIDGSKINILDLQGRTNAKTARAKYNIPQNVRGDS
tara:strand:+ start:21 stop:341 length:321 start_codon:yes stop_codon:yes gene_type:complete